MNKSIKTKKIWLSVFALALVLVSATLVLAIQGTGSSPNMQSMMTDQKNTKGGAQDTTGMMGNMGMMSDNEMQQMMSNMPNMDHQGMHEQMLKTGKCPMMD